MFLKNVRKIKGGYKKRKGSFSETCHECAHKRNCLSF